MGGDSLGLSDERLSYLAQLIVVVVAEMYSKTPLERGLPFDIGGLVFMVSCISGLSDLERCEVMAQVVWDYVNTPEVPVVRGN